MGILRVSDASGITHVLEAVEGWRVMELIRDHGLPIEAICGGACACATCHVQVAPDLGRAARTALATMRKRCWTRCRTRRRPRACRCQIIWDTHLDGLEVTLAGSRRRMRYFPLFADLETAQVLVAGGGEQAAQKVRLLRKTGGAHHRRGRKPSPTSCARWRATARCCIVLRGRSLRAIWTASAWSMPRTGDRALDAAVSRAARPAASPSMSSTPPSCPPSSRRPSSTAIRSRWRSAPKAQRRCWRARSRPGSRAGCPPTSAGSPQRARCAARASSPRSFPMPRARRRLWERLLQGPVPPRRAERRGRRGRPHLRRRASGRG